MINMCIIKKDNRAKLFLVNIRIHINKETKRDRSANVLTSKQKISKNVLGGESFLRG